MKTDIKLNLGASPIWFKNSWVSLDHKAKKNSNFVIKGDINNVNLPDNSCKLVFCSHTLEHIPHLKIPKALSEINRIMKKGAILRIIVPDLEKITKAYVKKDKLFFKKALREDESIRTDLGLGGMLMNFIVSPGQDTILLNRNLSEFIAGYAHLYAYDYQMLSTLLNKAGFKCKRSKFKKSSINELRTPLHVKGLKSEWQNLNQKFYKKNKLVHIYKNGRYQINFNLTGFDRDPISSLFIECKKTSNVNSKKLIQQFNHSDKNYNKYAFSLLKDKKTLKKLKKLKIKI